MYLTDVSFRIPVQGPYATSATEYLRLTSKLRPPAQQESDLLKAVRIALRGSEADNVSDIQTSYFVTNEDPWEEEELTWNGHAVVVSVGGVLKKAWNFEEEGQFVQYATMGWLEQNRPTPDGAANDWSSATNEKKQKAEEPHQHSADGGRPTFGPFFSTQTAPKPTPPSEARVPAVFIFLRSIGKIFLKNGLQYTFSLPFIVRKAWPISPHGVMIQRVLEPSEIQEAETSGDPVLPTIFSVTSPFSEAGTVGLTAGIVGGADSIPPTLLDEDENSIKPLRSVLPSEMVVWASHCGPESPHDILVTIDTQKHQLSVWRYVYIKPKDLPAPLVQNEPSTSKARNRQSMSGLGAAGRRTSALFNELEDRRDRRHPRSPNKHSPDHSPVADFPELPPLSALPGMPPALSTTTTMASLVSGGSSQWIPHFRDRGNSITRHDLSLTLDKMALAGRLDNDSLMPIEHGRMKAAYWVERLYSCAITPEESASWRTVSVALFDHRWDGTSQRSLLSICIPTSAKQWIFSVSFGEDKMLKVTLYKEFTAIAATSIRATRENVWDLLVVKPDSKLSLYTHGTREYRISVSYSVFQYMIKQNPEATTSGYGQIVGVQNSCLSSSILHFRNGWRARISLNMIPTDLLTKQCLQILALSLPAEMSFSLHTGFLARWAKRGFSTAPGIEIECFRSELFAAFGLPDPAQSTSILPPVYSWHSLGQGSSHFAFREDPALQRLKLPPTVIPPLSGEPIPKPHKHLTAVLYALHTLGENLRLSVDHHSSILPLAGIICRIAWVIRPEWADYWKRLCPDALPEWPSLEKVPKVYRPQSAGVKPTSTSTFDDRMPVWPPDVTAILYGRLNSGDWKVPWADSFFVATRLGITPSFEYGRLTPLKTLHQIMNIYQYLSDSTVPHSQKRAENAVHYMVTNHLGSEFLDRLPLGIAAPLREAARSCQLAPPGDWPLDAYKAIGRNDLAASATNEADLLFSGGYRPTKDFINPPRPRPTISQIIARAKEGCRGEMDVVLGTELDLDDFTSIRFGQDRRLEEVARMLCSATVPSIKIMERPELSEHDQAKEHQNQVVRIAERTLALPYGRAIYTYGCVLNVTREAFLIPKLDFTVRMQPLNITVAPEPGKILVDSISWGEFHNGVAAGLRIAPTASGVENSWIAYNKPNELTPEHAGFLFGLGLTGHLREMVTWHRFSYLTPKHDLTSIGVLLGLSAAHVGSGDKDVTKLLAVHMPALLPTPTVDLNVSLMTQAAGLAGVGLLYMGTRNRRMAEVCLNQVSRKDLVQPDLSNEHREAYTYSAALAFGMIMLGKGTTIPADMVLLSRISVLIHGDADSMLGRSSRPPFDINLTSPAATIALGLMFLRTERQDIADILTIPDTPLSLNRIQPSFLLMRTISRSLIMWDSILPSNEWVLSQVPVSIRDTLETRSKDAKPIDDALELAYYNIIAGSCFVIGLKFAGTARQEAYAVVIRHHDLFTRLVYSNGLAFDHKIRRSAVRDGLNLISISLSMIMAGTGEISCFRRLRYAFGMYQQMYQHPLRYGIHAATHTALGLLFLGGGRFTLGTSDAAIACMVTAFFPRYPQTSTDNKCYLQALRHLWVLAVEPRCLIARDVDTTEVVYLPIKITTKEGPAQTETTQLISPTLIPDLHKLKSLRVDTPRYWPFYLDTENIPRHRERLLRSQTLYVKRRTAFLSYTEDPKGSRSLFVRSGSSAGDAATLDFPQLTDTKTHPAGDLSEFITSFSNDVLFLAFADHLSRPGEGDTPAERLFNVYSHASLLDSILQDKPQTLQSHLTLFLYRNMTPHTSRYFHLQLQDLRLASDFYSRMYERRFSGRTENNPRPPLVRDTTVLGALHALDQRLEGVRVSPVFRAALGKYARGESVVEIANLQQTDVASAISSTGTSNSIGTAPAITPSISRELAWYLLRNGVPVYLLLVLLRGLARDAYVQCLGAEPPEGTSDAVALNAAIKQVLHGTGTKMSSGFASGWTARSLEEIINACNDTQAGVQALGDGES